MNASSVIECVRDFGIAAHSSWTVDHSYAERNDIVSFIMNCVMKSNEINSHNFFSLLGRRYH